MLDTLTGFNFKLKFFPLKQIHSVFFCFQQPWERAIK